MISGAPTHPPQHEFASESASSAIGGGAHRLVFAGAKRRILCDFGSNSPARSAGFLAIPDAIYLWEAPDFSGFEFFFIILVFEDFQV